MSEQRGTPVTLEEMTRRRDGWRQRYESALKTIGSLNAQNVALAKHLRATEVGHGSCDATIRRLHSELAASRAEARRFAEECGRLRDMLVTPRVAERVLGDE